MIRSFAVALITIVVVVLFGPSNEVAAAQPANSTGAVPFQFTGATPGLNLELFVNAGKVADVVIDSNGNGSSILDLSNLGKVQLQVYVDVCQDGKVVRVIVAAGQPKPGDNCKRRVAGGAWWSDCGVTRLTLNLTKFGMRVIGCGSMLTQPKVYGPLVGGLVLIPVALAGGDTPTTFASTPPATTAPPTATNPPATTTPAPPVTPPTTTPVTPPTTPTPPATATGNYLCTLCMVKFDVSRHDPTLRLCQALTAVFNLIQGSLTIRHPSPFIEVSGANYNTTTGDFDISGSGSIAGFNNVAARAVGTVNTQTGRVTFDYTLGSNGVFPGGQPITYTVTLQKQ